jgi:hypothetical protein
MLKTGNPLRATVEQRAAALAAGIRVCHEPI